VPTWFAIWNRTANGSLSVDGKAGRIKVIEQQAQWRSGAGERAWLSLLVETLERLSDLRERRIACDPEVVLAAEAHLRHAAYPAPLPPSHFSLRN
jgi:hypothetical protein